jgi:hypothetical protein
MNEPRKEDLPTVSQLLRGTVVALIIASVVLVTAVLPAEYGIDPTGIGKAAGLYRPRVVAPPPAEMGGASSAPAAAGLLRATVPFRSDDTSITLEPGEGAEIKLVMKQGERFAFSWTSNGGAVDMDMHGEPAGSNGDDATSYWKEDGLENGHGAFEAPVTGNHGWFWQNLGAEKVTITLKTSGFYERVFRP